MTPLIILILIVILIAPLAICWSLWLLFALLALIPNRRLTDSPTPPNANSIKINILIPAHNEALLVPLLLKSLEAQTSLGKSQLGTILVIADHCTDQTAPLARSFPNIQVLERNSGPRGKPAALREGLAHLLTLSPSPQVTLSQATAIVDADCTTSPNLVEQFAHAMNTGHKAAQCANLVFDPAAPNNLSTIAFSLKNLIRPKGMAILGIPTQLFGTGMCFHNSLLADGGGGGPIKFSDHLTEDLAVSHDLLLKKIPPIFLAAAMVRSPIPTDNSSMSTQKLRWETGQLHTWKKIPLVLLKLLAKLQFRSALALLDWSAPPVAMAALAWTAITALATLFVILHLAPWQLLLLPAAVLSILIAYIAIGTLELAGPSALLRLLFAIPRFFFWKLTLYLRMLTGQGAKGWQKSRYPSSHRPPGGPLMTTAQVSPTIENRKSKIENLRRRATLLGMPLDAFTEQETLTVLTHRINNHQPTWVLTPNLDILRHYHKTPDLRPLFHRNQGGADLLLADGMPLIWASKLANRHPILPERVAGSTLAVSLAKLAADNNWKLFLLGGAPGDADLAAQVLQQNHPTLKIAGTHCPPLGFENDPIQLQAIQQMLQLTKPHLVYVALGFPKQERLIQHLRQSLPTATFLGVGISLSFIAGTVTRAPRWLQKIGLEWTHRLIQEPKRLAKRYLLHDLPFALLTLFPKALATRFKRKERSD